MTDEKTKALYAKFRELYDSGEYYDAEVIVRKNDLGALLNEQEKKEISRAGLEGWSLSYLAMSADQEEKGNLDLAKMYKDKSDEIADYCYKLYDWNKFCPPNEMSEEELSHIRERINKYTAENSIK